MATRNHETLKRDAHMPPQVIVFLSCPTAVSAKRTTSTRPSQAVVAVEVSSRNLSQVRPSQLAMALTVAAVDAIRERLAAIPEKDGAERKVTRLEAIARMTDEILGLRKRGYSWKEVAEIVSSEGCRVTVGSLKTVLWKRGVTSRGKARSSTKGAGPRRPSQPTSQSPGVAGRVEPAVGVNSSEPRECPKPTREPGTFVPREDTKDI
jgi:hypothetical protein